MAAKKLAKETEVVSEPNAEDYPLKSIILTRLRSASGNGETALVLGDGVHNYQVDDKKYNLFIPFGQHFAVITPKDGSDWKRVVPLAQIRYGS